MKFSRKAIAIPCVTLAKISRASKTLATGRMAVKKRSFFYSKWRKELKQQVQQRLSVY